MTLLYNEQVAEAMAIIAPLLIFFAIFAVFLIICQWIVYSKAGQPGWAVLIPIYNLIIMLKIVGKPAWWFFLLLIPFVNFIIIIIVMNELSKSFGKDAGFTVGLILLPMIFYPILAFGSAKYIGPGGVPVDAGVSPQV